MEGKIFTQKEIMDIMIPELKSSGINYKKVKEVFARKAVEGEKIITETSDGIETFNTAKSGDFIIKNQTQAGEMYIVGGSKFHDRYDFFETAEDNFSIYKAKGKIIAIEMTSSFLEKINMPDSFLFIAPWSENMIVKKDDFLVSLSDYSQIYRIARKEFFETYKQDF